MIRLTKFVSGFPDFLAAEQRAMVGELDFIMLEDRLLVDR